MYLDRLYTKLYSDKDWDGLATLISEIKTFSKSTYENLDRGSARYLRYLRNHVARRLKDARDRANQSLHSNNPNDIPSAIREIHGNKQFIDDYQNSSGDKVKSELRKLAENFNNYRIIHDDYKTIKNKKFDPRKFGSYASDDIDSLNEAIEKNKSKLIGDKNVGSLSSYGDDYYDHYGEIAPTQAVVIGERWNDSSGNQRFIPKKLEVVDTQVHPEDRVKYMEKYKGKPLKTFGAWMFNPYFSDEM